MDVGAVAGRILYLFEEFISLPFPPVNSLSRVLPHTQLKLPAAHGLDKSFAGLLETHPFSKESSSGSLTPPSSLKHLWQRLSSPARK